MKKGNTDRASVALKWIFMGRKPMVIAPPKGEDGTRVYSHSMVDGGFDEMS
ncbi:MAG: hypothetical protein I3J02_11250 [Prevotella sp.]|nr:hypothetical protein [Prevotella sp.]